MTKTILIISTLNTKGEETFYLKDKIEEHGLKTLLLDISMRGDQNSNADITPDRVAAAGGSSFEEIRSSKDRARITNITIAGAANIAKKLQEEEKILIPQQLTHRSQIHGINSSPNPSNIPR